MTASQAAPVLRITPASALIDSPIDIRISGLQPASLVTLRARVTLSANRHLGAWASFFADAQGVVDVGSQVPAAGTYHVADATGLIWSLAPEETWDEDVADLRFIDTGLRDYTVAFTLEVRGRAVASADIVRQPVAHDVVRQEVREDGLVGTLFLPPGDGPHPAIIVVPGSGGGIPESLSALYASHGYATLALGYFRAGEPGLLPADLASIPLEYFEAAFAWVARHPQLDTSRLIFNGTSRGGELALLLGSRYPQLTAIIAWVPSSHVWGSVSTQDRRLGDQPAWTYQGQPVPFVPRTPEARDLVPREGGTSKTPDFLRSVENYGQAQEAAIPVERIAGPVLLISAQDDALWPSGVFSHWVEARLRTHGFPHAVTHLNYENAGHTLGPAVNPSTFLVGGLPSDSIRLAYGGTPQGVARARADLWPKVLQFIRGHVSR